MRDFTLHIAIILALSLIVVISFYKWFPLSLIDGPQKFGSTITTIAAGDTLSASRSVINTNFSNLNTDKIETTNIDTCAEVAALGSLETGTCGSLVLSVSPTLTGTATLASASTTNLSADTLFKVGANGSDIHELKATTCNLLGMDASHNATSTKPYQCNVTGVASDDVVLAQLSTTTANTLYGGWVITSAVATTSSAVQITILNLTGAAAVPSATAVGSSTNIWYADI